MFEKNYKIPKKRPASSSGSQSEQNNKSGADSNPRHQEPSGYSMFQNYKIPKKSPGNSSGSPQKKVENKTVMEKDARHGDDDPSKSSTASQKNKSPVKSSSTFTLASRHDKRHEETRAGTSRQLSKSNQTNRVRPTIQLYDPAMIQSMMYQEMTDMDVDAILDCKVHLLKRYLVQSRHYAKCQICQGDAKSFTEHCNARHLPWFVCPRSACAKCCLQLNNRPGLEAHAKQEHAGEIFELPIALWATFMIKYFNLVADALQIDVANIPKFVREHHAGVNSSKLSKQIMMYYTCEEPALGASTAFNPGNPSALRDCCHWRIILRLEGFTKGKVGRRMVRSMYPQAGYVFLEGERRGDDDRQIRRLEAVKQALRDERARMRTRQGVLDFLNVPIKPAIPSLLDMPSPSTSQLAKSRSSSSDPGRDARYDSHPDRYDRGHDLSLGQEYDDSMANQLEAAVRSGAIDLANLPGNIRELLEDVITRKRKINADVVLQLEAQASSMQKRHHSVFDDYEDSAGPSSSARDDYEREGYERKRARHDDYYTEDDNREEWPDERYQSKYDPSADHDTRYTNDERRFEDRRRQEDDRYLDIERRSQARYADDERKAQDARYADDERTRNVRYKDDERRSQDSRYSDDERRDRDARYIDNERRTPDDRYTDNERSGRSYHKEYSQDRYRSHPRDKPAQSYSDYHYSEDRSSRHSHEAERDGTPKSYDDQYRNRHEGNADSYAQDYRDERETVLHHKKELDYRDETHRSRSRSEIELKYRKDEDLRRSETRLHDRDYKERIVPQDHDERHHQRLEDNSRSQSHRIGQDRPYNETNAPKRVISGDEQVQGLLSLTDKLSQASRELKHHHADLISRTRKEAEGSFERTGSFEMDAAKHSLERPELHSHSASVSGKEHVSDKYTPFVPTPADFQNRHSTSGWPRHVAEPPAIPSSQHMTTTRTHRAPAPATQHLGNQYSASAVPRSLPVAPPLTSLAAHLPIATNQSKSQHSAHARVLESHSGGRSVASYLTPARQTTPAQTGVTPKQAPSNRQVSPAPSASGDADLEQKLKTLSEGMLLLTNAVMQMNKGK